MEQKSIIRVKEVMQKNEIVTIDGMAKASDAAALMRSHNILCLMVTKRDPDDEWGIIVVQDLVRGVMLSNRSAKDVHVYEIMTKPVITVPADMDIRYATRLIYRAGIRRAPVTENNELVGMVSLSSLVLDYELF